VRAPFAPVRRELDVVLVGGVASGFLLLLIVSALKFGVLGLVVPLGALVALALLANPGVALGIGVTLVILAEAGDFGLFPQSAKLYTEILPSVTPVDGFLALSIGGVLLRRVVDGGPVRLPPIVVALPALVLAFGLVSGVVVGHAAGASSSLHVVLATHTFVYAIIIPLLIVNLEIDRDRLVQLFVFGLGLAALKALLGLAAVAAHRGVSVGQESVLTYYSPTANWLTTLALLGVLAAAGLRSRVPWWAVATAVLSLLSLALSYRRSFWIGDAIAVMLVLLLALGARRIRLVVPVVAAVAIGLWSLGNIALQSDTPIGQRVQSLSPSKLSVTADDRYRLDERANVFGEIKRHPVSGLGIEVPWAATTRSLPTEVNPDHLYVHFAVLYWWLKLGILGLLAYVGLLAGAAWLSIRVWVRAREPMFQAFGLASLASVAALVVIETTATFSGTDPRFTLLFGVQLGLLAVIDRQSEPPA
jgi:O-antigen ligase